MLRFGTVRAFHKETYTADVELAGHQETILAGIPVAYSVREDLLVDGAKCVLLVYDELAPASAVLLALYGGRPAEDPLFDPVVGHKHRGLLRDGPKLEGQT